MNLKGYAEKLVWDKCQRKNLLEIKDNALEEFRKYNWKNILNLILQRSINLKGAELVFIW